MHSVKEAKYFSSLWQHVYIWRRKKKEEKFFFLSKRERIKVDIKHNGTANCKSGTRIKRCFRAIRYR